MVRDGSRSAKKYVFKRDKRASRKAELGRYFGALDWSTLFSPFERCDDLLNLFYVAVHTGLNLLLPVKRVCVNTSDAPWMTQHLKSLILKRQKAFHRNGTASSQYKLYRNLVNRERKKCKARFYKIKVESMKDENPKMWWKEVKRLCGANSKSGDLVSQIHAIEVQDLPPQELANVINKAFLEPLEEYRLYQPLTRLPTDQDLPDLFDVSELRIQKLLSKLNPSKASGPDDIPNWLLREYAELLAFPVSKIINVSFKEQRLPRVWKLADVSPLPKKKPVNDLQKDLRPISLTSCLSKVAEECVVVEYVKPAVLKILDPNQYGAVPKSSTTQALIHMVHIWAKETDGNGATARVILFDYRKAFDLIDHSILQDKLCKLDLPNAIINWIIDFLSDRFQRVKLSNGCFSEWGSVPSGVPQGTKLGPWLFLILINDLEISTLNGHLWKYVDDTTTSEIVPKGKDSNAQLIANRVAQWSSENRVQLNRSKCKELRISFAKDQQVFDPISIDGNEIEIVKKVKLLGVTISNNLSWNDHIIETVKKAAKRLYFLVQLKRANLPCHDLVLFYATCVRSILTYAIPVFNYALPAFLKLELERIQKRALAIICPSVAYNDALGLLGIPTIATYNEAICEKVFDSIVEDNDNRLKKLLPPKNNPAYSLRHNRSFSVPKWKTERFKKTFIITSSLKRNVKQ